MTRRKIATILLVAMGGATAAIVVALDRWSAGLATALPPVVGKRATIAEQPIELTPGGHRVDRSQTMPQILLDEWQAAKLPQVGPAVPAGISRVWGYRGKDLEPGNVLRIESQVWQAGGDFSLSPAGALVFEQPGAGPQRLWGDVRYPIRRYECIVSGPIATSIADGPGRTLLVSPR